MRRVRDLALRQSLARTRDRDESEDIAQEVAVQVFLQLARFRFRSRFSSWVYRITENEIRTFLRRKRSGVSAEQRAWPLQDGADCNPRVESQIDAKEAWDAVGEILTELPTVQRQVLQLVAFDHFRPCEVAQFLGKSQTNVRASLHRARVKVREQLLETAPHLAVSP
jgi:RNA polymerase sigma-70 factor (ECF subfamily)